MKRPDHISYFPIDGTQRYVDHTPLEWREEDGYIIVSCESPYYLYGIGKSWESAMGELYLMASEYLQWVLGDSSNFAQDLLDQLERVSKLVVEVPPCTGCPSTLAGVLMPDGTWESQEEPLFWWRDDRYHVILVGPSPDDKCLFMYATGSDIPDTLRSLKSQIQKDLILERSSVVEYRLGSPSHGDS